MAFCYYFQNTEEYKRVLTIVSEINSNITYIFLNDPHEIIKYLHIGINIPIWKEFYKYILHDLTFFQTTSILLKVHGSPAGHVLLYHDDESTLYFGYFSVINHNDLKIKLLIERMIHYAKENHFKILRGPINIPTVIYGWGFMGQGSLENLFVGRPVNPAIYQELFLKNGFSIIVKEISWEGSIPKFDPQKLTAYDFNVYEFFNPKNLNELMELKSVFQELHYKFLPSNSIITPRIADLFNNYAEYVFKYGGSHMFFFIRHKPSGKIVACGSNLPNPFQKDINGNYDSFVAYTIAIEPEHRKKGLALFATGTNFSKMLEKNMRYISGPADSEHEISTHIAKKLGLINQRIHLILELQL